MKDTSELDPRTNAYRFDLADLALKGAVEAKRFVEGKLHHCVRGVVPVYKSPSETSERVTEIKYGEFVDVFEQRKDFAWIQNRSDRYVGYIKAKDALTETIAALMNRVSAMSTYVYDEPDLKSPIIDQLTLGSYVSLDGEKGDFYPLTSGGYVFKKHIAPTDEVQTTDYVFTAGQLLGRPYLWGGRTPLGLDCAGLVQLALDIAGIDCPRDCDQQRDLFGHPLPCHWRDVVWKRGDLVFFDKHVGIMAGNEYMIHADARAMQVVVEPLKNAVAQGREVLAAGRP